MCKIYLQYILSRPLKINFYTALQIMIREHFFPSNLFQENQYPFNFLYNVHFLRSEF